MAESLNRDELMGWLETTNNIVKILESRLELVSSPRPRDQPQTSPVGTIELSNDNLKVGNIVVPLGFRPRTAQLVRAFFTNSEQFLSKEEIMIHVYDVSPDSSSRLKESNSQNLLKLMSRSKKFLEDACDLQGSSLDIEWFPFDKKTKKWRLYRINDLSDLGRAL